jgi:hypothetical protein
VVMKLPCLIAVLCQCHPCQSTLAWPAPFLELVPSKSIIQKQLVERTLYITPFEIVL